MGRKDLKVPSRRSQSGRSREGHREEHTREQRASERTYSMGRKEPCSVCGGNCSAGGCTSGGPKHPGGYTESSRYNQNVYQPSGYQYHRNSSSMSTYGDASDSTQAASSSVRGHSAYSSRDSEVPTEEGESNIYEDYPTDSREYTSVQENPTYTYYHDQSHTTSQDYSTYQVSSNQGSVSYQDYSNYPNYGNYGGTTEERGDSKD